MKLIRAYTDDLEAWGPILVLELAGNPPAVVDAFQKQTLVAAGVAILFPLEEDGELAGFDTIEVQTDSSDPASRLTIEPSRSSAPTRDPRILELVRDFLRSLDDLTFRPGVQIYPAA